MVPFVLEGDFENKVAVGRTINCARRCAILGRESERAATLVIGYCMLLCCGPFSVACVSGVSCGCHENRAASNWRDMSHEEASNSTLLNKTRHIHVGIPT